MQLHLDEARPESVGVKQPAFGTMTIRVNSPKRCEGTGPRALDRRVRGLSVPLRAGPAAQPDQEEFGRTFRGYADKLPSSVGRVFALREVDELGSKDICALLNISESNLWVMLHRARMALRRCLEINWFEDPGQALSPQARERIKQALRDEMG